MIPLIINHNGELFALKSTVSQQREAIKIANKIKKKHRRFRIKFFENKYCVYVEVK